MSLHSVTVGFLSLKPRIRDYNDCLILKSSWLYKLCYLFACSQKVIFNRESKLISLKRRKWWFIRYSDTIPFHAVEEVGFWSKAIAEHAGGDPFWGDRYEYVWLVLQIRNSDKVVKLIPFEGEGSKETGLIGVLLGDSIFDFRGNHAEAAYWARRRIKQTLETAEASDSR